MANGYHRVRGDLELRPESEAADSPVVVKDPITQRFFRFTAVQAAVLERLDGKSGSAELAGSVSERFGTAVTEKQVDDFAAKLRDLLLLDEQSCWTRLESAGKKRRRLLGNLLSVKILRFNPDRYLARLERKVRFCFGSVFGLAAAASIFAAVVISVVNLDSLFYSMGALATLYSVPLVLAVAFVIMSIHEMAHGVALKHYGGRVEEMGLMVMYFIPAFYCDVSDAWMLRKRERMLVTIAGSYVQTVVWAWATILWRFLAPEALVSRICLIIIGFAGIQTLVNFVPFIRLDGYYLLSDWLGIPNLRSKAFSHLKSVLAGSLSGALRYRPGFLPRRRERRIYFAYGTAAFAFTAGLTWIMLTRIGGWLVREYQIWGILLLSTLFLMAMPVASREAVAESAGGVGGVMVRIKKLPRLLLILAALILGGFLPWELKVSGDFTILPQAEVSVTPQVDGTLKVILVTEGDAVASGHALAEMENFDLKNEHEETKGELAARSASLDLLRAGTRPEEIDRARRNIATKQAEFDNALRVDQERKVLQDSVAKKAAELDNAQKNWERSQRLLAAGLVSRNDAERDQTTYEVRQKELAEAQGYLKVLDERIDRTRQIKKKELDQARSELTILEAGSRKEAIRAVEAEVAKLEEKRKILEQQLEQLTVRSPIDGIVATPYLQNRVGEYTKKGDIFCRIVNVRVVRVDMPVPEKEIADVQPGHPIVLKVRGYPRRAFEARVKAISPVAIEGGAVRQIIVQGELENPEGILRPGMTGVGKILCGKRTVAELTSRRAIRWIRTEFWQYLP